jgi:hypothetical protein
MRAHGLDWPRLINASVLPPATSTNTNAGDHDRREGCNDDQGALRTND